MPAAINVSAPIQKWKIIPCASMRSFSPVFHHLSWQRFHCGASERVKYSVMVLKMLTCLETHCVQVKFKKMEEKAVVRNFKHRYLCREVEVPRPLQSHYGSLDLIKGAQHRSSMMPPHGKHSTPMVSGVRYHINEMVHITR